MTYVNKKNLKASADDWMEDAASFTYERNDFQLDAGACALLVIDMQNYFVSPKGRSHLPASRAILSNISELCSQFRKARRPVFFTQHGHESDHDLGILGDFWGDHIVHGENDWNIVPELKPEKEDIKIFKTRYDAFYKTPLEKTLHERNHAHPVATLCTGDAKKGSLYAFTSLRLCVPLLSSFAYRENETKRLIPVSSG